nr:flagellar export chaperone FliS [Nitrospirota bacterium]
MLATHKIQVYRQNQVQQASPIELIVLLYDKAITRLGDAIRCMQEGRIAEKGTAICHAVDIITELQAVLDKDRGGEIAAKLDQLYTYMVQQLTVANYENDLKPMADVACLLEELQQGWKGLAQQMAGGAQTPAGYAKAGAPMRQLNSVG